MRGGKNPKQSQNPIAFHAEIPLLKRPQLFFVYDGWSWPYIHRQCRWWCPFDNAVTIPFYKLCSLERSHLDNELADAGNSLGINPPGRT